MFNRYFQEEISNLHDLAAEFSRAYPALAPSLGGQRSDPDVERLLEGVAFLTGLVRQKIDDEFPELVQGLLQMVFPHYLRPLPAATIIEFTPTPSLNENYRVKAGSSLASKPVQGTQCLFKTCFDVDTYPLTIKNAYFEQPPGKPPSICLDLQFTNSDLSAWYPNKLRFHVTKDYPTASNIYYILLNKLRNIVITPSSGTNPITLEPELLAPAGFADKEVMIPYPAHSFSGYRMLQEYFLLPEKFLFLELNGLGRWRNKGADTSFKIAFELKELDGPPPKIDRESFSLFATPAINIFSHEADPILLDHKKSEYKVRPAGTNSTHYQVYSVDEVTGYKRGSLKSRKYEPFELFHAESSETPVFHVSSRRSPINNLFEVRLSFTYPQDAGPPSPETLSIKLTCTNGELTDNLQIGDISMSTQTSPGLLNFRNLRPPTSSVLPPLGKTLLWRFMSLYSLNYLPLANTANLKALLNHYIFTDSKDKVSVYANTRKIEGITNVDVEAKNQLITGYVMRGQEIKLKLFSDHFASEGDLYLFGTIMDNFLGSYANINTFTRLVVEDGIKGDIYKWPTRLGDRALI